MSNKHLPGDLKQMQSLPLEAKIIMSTQRIAAWFNHWLGEVYVAFSGGIDSTVLADLVARYCKQTGYKLYLCFVNTGLEYPEIQKFVKTFAEWLQNTYNIAVQLDIVRPKMRFDEVLKKYGYPIISKSVSHAVKIAKRNPDGKVMKNLFTPENKGRFGFYKWKFLIDSDIPASDECCNIMKKAPAKQYAKETGRMPILGTMADESSLRYSNWLKHGCNAFEGKSPSSQPISFWTKQDILHYIKKYDVPYCPVYGDIVVKPQDDTVDEDQINIIDYLGCYEEEDVLTTTGCDRTGCIFCMFGCHLEKEPNRFQRLKETHPRQYEYCIGGGEYVYEAFKKDENGKWQEFDLAWEYDDGTPMTTQEIERFVQVHSVGFAGQKEEDLWIKFEKRWQPSKEGLGLGKVLDYIGVKYE